MPSVEQQRRVGRNLIALQGAKGIPEDLVLSQERQFKGFRAATLLTEEFVGVGEPEAGEWLSDKLTRLFKSNTGRALLPPPVFDFAKSNSDPAMLMHSSILHGGWQADYLLCAQSASDEFRTSVLCYHPAPDLLFYARRFDSKSLSSLHQLPSPLIFHFHLPMNIDSPQPSRVHYTSPTQGGSSWSPTYWQVIALHHSGDTHMFRLNGKDGTYPANEGIWIQSICRVARSSAKDGEIWRSP